MKKLVICYWSLGIGGIGSRLRGLLAELDKRDDVQVYCLLKRRTDDESFSQSLSNIKLLYFSDSVYEGQQLAFMWWLLKNIFLIKPTNSLGFLNRFTFVLVIGKFWLKITEGYNLKVSVDQPTSMKKHLAQHEFFLVWYPLMILLFRVVDKVTVPTKANRDELKKRFFVPDKKINVIYSNVSIVD